MQLPKLTPLQSRLLASAIATSLVVVFWVSFQPRSFVYAAEIHIPPGFVQHSEIEELIPQALPNPPAIDTSGDRVEGGQSNAGYVPDFAYFDRSVIGRQEEESRNLTNNQADTAELNPNGTVYFRFEGGHSSGTRIRSVLDVAREESRAENTSERDALEDAFEGLDLEGEGEQGGLSKRQSLKQTVWISVNTCEQPSPDLSKVKLITSPPPQLTLHVSTSEQKPGATTSDTQSFDFVGGYANFTTNTTSNLYMGVSGPSLTDGWQGSWSFELAASTDGYYHSYNNATEYMFMIDTDSDSTLFVTYNVSDSDSPEEVDKWEKNNPFTLYAFSSSDWSNMVGLERSFCGLRKQFPNNNISVGPSVTTDFGGGKPKAMFNVQNLETDKAYTGFLAVSGNGTDAIQLPLGGTVRAGGQVFKQFNWTTKSDDSCQVIFDLKFCDKVAYAVPSSSTFKTNDSGLMTLYDELAESYMANFNKSLDQIACDTTSTSQYSLARNCTDCRNDYKSWLCSVVVPRCEDFTSPEPWLQPRNINTAFANGTLPYAHNTTAEFNRTMRERMAYNQSRVPMIDDLIKPGPYKELLPCDDLCWDIVRSCPATLAFACPNPPADRLTYGSRDPAGKDLMCNFPGAVVSLNQDRGGAGTLAARFSIVVLVAVSVASFGWI